MAGCMRTGMLPLGLLMLVSVPALAANAERGRALYENQCRFCHEHTVHLSADRHATGLDDLHRRVAAWSTHAALGWSDEEIADVVEYLNQAFYHFPSPAGD